MLKAAVEDVDDDLATVDGAEHDESESGQRLAFASDFVDELQEAR